MSSTHLDQSEIEKRLRYIYRIDNHPVGSLPQPIITHYLDGLGAALYDVAKGDDFMRLLFEQWAFSISGDNHSSSYKTDKSAIKSALSLFRVKWKLLRLKYEFFFDCYYLTEKYNASQLKKLATYFQDAIPYFAKKALKDVDSIFLSETECKRIPQTLIKHRLANNNWSKRKPKKLLVVANMSAGKSTLINALVGYRLNRIRTTVCTSRICSLYNNRYNKEGIITYSDQSSFFPEIESTSSDIFTNASLRFNSSLNDSAICVIDTPGYNNVDHPEHRKTTEDIIKSNHYDAILYVANCQYIGTTDEAMLLEFIRSQTKKNVIFAINQMDKMKPSEDSIQKMVSDFRTHLKRMKFSNPMIVPVSAKAALMFKLGKGMLDEEDSVDYDEFSEKFGKDYYDLQNLGGGTKSANPLDATGIKQLETIINHILQ